MNGSPDTHRQLIDYRTLNSPIGERPYAGARR
jgi:hypothetical protein